MNDVSFFLTHQTLVGRRRKSRRTRRTRRTGTSTRRKDVEIDDDLVAVGRRKKEQMIGKRNQEIDKPENGSLKAKRRI